MAGISTFYGIQNEYNGTARHLCELGAQLGIDHYLVFSVATKPQQTRSINAFIADSVACSCGKMTGLGTVHPDSDTLEADVRHIMELGLRGVKLHFDFQAITADDPRCMRIYAICQEHGLPVLVHTGDYRYDYSNPARIVRVLEAFPKLTVVGAHLGGWSVWEDARRLLSRYPNFHVDCSSSLYALSPQKALEIIRSYGAERVLFGTDYPMWPIDKELALFHALDLTNDERELILHGNAERLFGIPAAK